MDVRNQNAETAMVLFPLPCACQSLRRLTRLVTRIYDQELRKADIEVTQFGLLTGLAALGEANQKTLSAGFAMDSTTLTPLWLCCAGRVGSVSSEGKTVVNVFFV